MAKEPAATLVVATNPVDILTHVAAEVSGLPWGRVLGSGTTLDSARLRFLLGSHFEVDPRSVHAYVIGEHGDTAVPVWSSASVGGVKLDDLPLPGGRSWDDRVRSTIFEQTRTAAYEVIKRKRATYYAIGLALLAVVEAVLRNQGTILTVSVPLRGEHGEKGMALSLPAVVGRSGAREVLPLPLSPAERAAFILSADTLRARLAAA
jgi:L-lactate dehydrogenase